MLKEKYATDARIPLYLWKNKEMQSFSEVLYQKALPFPRQYPNSQKAPDALLKIGYCQYEQKQWAQAEATLNQVLQKYPNTTVANLAQGRLRALKLEAQH